jgi:two-component system, NtrC family, nitrogen regulation sensor histidine kinase NtrY
MMVRGREGDGESGWQSPDHSGRRLPGPGWIGGWSGLLALAAWLSQLAWFWLALVALGGAVLILSVVRRPDPVRFLVGILLWFAVGVGWGVQTRLDEIAERWPELQHQVEESAAAALGEALDDLVGRGERAGAGAAEAAHSENGMPGRREMFDRLAELRRSTGVSAIALFAADGSPVAWAGEHRGNVPTAARFGGQSYVFHEGPLFSYVYFVHPLVDGTTAVAAVLLEASLDVGGGAPPFADRFEARHGVRPRFWLPERARAEAVWDWSTEGRPILSVSFVELTQQHWWLRVVEQGRRGVALVGLALLLLLSAGWYRARLPWTGAPVLMGTAALLIAPLGRILPAEILFSPLQFVLPGPLDVTLGVLLLLLVGGAVWMLTGRRRSPYARLAPAAALAILALLLPLALLLVERSAAEGLLAGRAAGGFAVQLASALLLAIPIYLAITYSRPPRRGFGNQRWLSIAAYAAPALMGLALVGWWGPGRPMPYVVAALWVLPVSLYLLLRGPRDSVLEPLRSWLFAGWVAGALALSFLWPLHVRAELVRAEREIAVLGTQADPFLDFLLRQFAERAQILAVEGETGVNLLYHSWVGSGLAREGYEARITLWREEGVSAELNLSELEDLPPIVQASAAQAGSGPVVEHLGGREGLHYLLVAPLPDERVATVAVPPRTRLAGAAALARFLHPEVEASAAARGETLYLAPIDPRAEEAHLPPLPRPDTVFWVRADGGWRSEAIVEMPGGPVHAHLVVPLPPTPLLLTRAVLLQAALLGTLLLIWLLARAICRDLASVPFLKLRWLRSFRGRLSVALFVFFLIPTLAFGFVAYGAVAREVVRSAAALAQQALDQAAARLPTAGLAEVGDAVRTDLLIFRQGSLVGATAPEIIELGLFHAWLPPEVYMRFAGGEGMRELEERRLGENDYLVAYRRLDPVSVVAAPIPLASHEITRRQQEFRDVALLLTLVGLGLSVVLAILVGRALARPLDQLSRAAATVGAGNLRTRLPETRTDEFGSVYASFNRMVGRLRRTRSALVQETRRTETIVAEAATGVLALDSEGRVELINPRAAEILGTQPETGRPLPRSEPPLGQLALAIDELWRSRSVEAAAEIELDGRIVRMKLRRLVGEDGGGGAVVALEDVTAEVRTARVLAWGEMARQVAHEIKNPLTPIKLAVQHVRRAFVDQRPDFGDILDRNVEAILREIDRLGDIARAFSRFGSPITALSPLEEVDVVRAIEETLALYQGAGDGARFHAGLPKGPLPAAVARFGELKEVLLNLLENAREALDGDGEVRITAGPSAEAGFIEIVVADTGPGIPEEQLLRIFEPHFSTRSSGTGLGLAIVRRIVDSWGGQVVAESELGAGTTFRVMLRIAEGGSSLDEHAPPASGG